MPHKPTPSYNPRLLTVPTLLAILLPLTGGERLPLYGSDWGWFRCFSALSVMLDNVYYVKLEVGRSCKTRHYLQGLWGYVKQQASGVIGGNAGIASA